MSALTKQQKIASLSESLGLCSDPGSPGSVRLCAWTSGCGCCSVATRPFRAGSTLGVALGQCSLASCEATSVLPHIVLPMPYETASVFAVISAQVSVVSERLSAALGHSSDDGSLRRSKIQLSVHPPTLQTQDQEVCP